MNRHLALSLAAMAAGALLQPVTTLADPPAHARNENSAEHRGYAPPRQHYDDDRWDDRHDERGDYDHRRWNYHDNYPRPGYAVRQLPPGPRVVHHHGHRYYYSRGAWYRPYGRGYLVVDPPVGLVLPFLPRYSTTLYFGGIPHYRAGPVYYVWNPRARGYVASDRPYRRW